MFQAIYDSPWTTTAAVAALALAAFALWLRRRSFLVAYTAIFTIAILLDALQAGSWSPLAGTSWAQRVAIAFVLVGDFRYFLLVERFARRPDARPADATAPSAWIGAVAFTLVVPILSAIVNHALAGKVTDARWTFLVYEAMFLLLALVLRFAVLPRTLAAAPVEVRTWLLRATTFEVGQYGLWALADVIILGGADSGFLLRLVPNALYYAFFVPFVAFLAPPEVDA